MLLSGDVDGNFMNPTVLTDVPPSAALWREVFGPVAVLSRFDDIAAAFAQVNDSRFGLHAGIFTNRLDHAWQAFAELEVGGVIVNDAPAYRVDNMPFGGVKDSGLGREGLRWAIEDMTETRTLVLARSPMTVNDRRTWMRVVDAIAQWFEKPGSSITSAMPGVRCGH